MKNILQTLNDSNQIKDSWYQRELKKDEVYI